MYLTGPPANYLELLCQPRIVEINTDLENGREVVKCPVGDCGIVISRWQRRKPGVNGRYYADEPAIRDLSG